MPYYAQLNEINVVSAVTETTEPLTPADHLVEVEGFDVGLIGRVYDAGTQSFTPAPPAAQPRHVSVGSFFDRFGQHKWGILADANPAVQALVKDCSVRKYIDLDDPQLPGGVAMLVGAGHAIDATAILTSPVQASERP